LSVFGVGAEIWGVANGAKYQQASRELQTILAELVQPSGQ